MMVQHVYNSLPNIINDLILALFLEYEYKPKRSDNYLYNIAL